MARGRPVLRALGAEMSVASADAALYHLSICADRVSLPFCPYLFLLPLAFSMAFTEEGVLDLFGSEVGKEGVLPFPPWSFSFRSPLQEAACSANWFLHVSAQAALRMLVRPRQVFVELAR